MNNILVALIFSLVLALPATAQLQANLYWNPVTVNGHPIESSAFSINTRGVLALVDGDLRSPKHRQVPFRLFIRRSGKIVKQWPAGSAGNQYSLQLHTLMPFVRFGDELVLEPVGVDGKWSRRIIRVALMNWINWFTGEGC